MAEILRFLRLVKKEAAPSYKMNGAASCLRALWESGGLSLNEQRMPCLR